MTSKLPHLLLISFLMIMMSCANDEPVLEDISTNTNQVLQEDLSQYENSAYGLYKGLFTTNNSEQRGVVEIEVIHDFEAMASIKLLNGNILSFTGVPVRNENGSLTIQLHSQNSSFEFFVEEDGSNSRINNAIFNNIPSFITMAKENIRGALITSTGLYTGSGFNGTFSIMFTDPASANGNSTSFTTQVMVNGNEIGTTTGNNQTNCVDDGTFQTCDVSGVSDTTSPIMMTWSGVHTSVVSTVTNCSQFEGSWQAIGTGGGDFSGTFSSDQQCTTPGNDECTGAELINCGDVFTASTASATVTGEPGEFCGVSNPNGPGIWYTYMGTAAGSIITVDLSGSNYDTRLYLYSGDCMNQICLDGDDDGGTSPDSLLSFREEEGVVYYLYAAGFAGATGTLNISVTCQETVENNAIAGAIPITPSLADTGFGGLPTFSFDFASTDQGITTASGLEGTCDGTETGLDRFFSWTATSEQLLFMSASPGRPGIVIRNTDGVELACLPTFGSGTLGEIGDWTLGEELIIQIYDFNTQVSEVAFFLEEL